MKAILTRYHGPTNTRGARISATADGWGRVSIPYPDELSGDACRWEAVKRLLDKGFTYHGNHAHNLVAGGLPNGDTVFCFANSGDYVWTPPHFAVTVPG